jgi:RHS repeat-associated protein
VRAGPEGTSLAEIAALAKRAKLTLEPVFRKPDEPIPVPSIVHWKVGHFAAIIGGANGRYNLDDPVFGRKGLWVTRAALDAEASGYFLAPASKTRATSWREVGMEEAGRVWGAGFIDIIWNLFFGPCGMCGYNIREAAVSLSLTDQPVGYAPPKGPAARVSITYNQREAAQPANFSYFNVSPKWTVSWLSFVQDDPASIGSNVMRFFPDGEAQLYSGYDATTGAFAPAEDDASVLVFAKTGSVSYKRLLKDGSVEIYAQSDGSAVYPRRVFLTKIIDPQGNALTLGYDKINDQVRLVSLIDATGRKTIFSYGSRVSPLLITKITDPFGRNAKLAYDGSGRLASITDTIGLTSRFTYDSSSLVNSLTTPYGVTHFAYGTSSQGGGTDNRRFLNVVDPLGYGEREETFEPTPVPFSDPSAPQGMPVPLFNQYLNYRDSFHWDKHQYAIGHCTPKGGCEYADARLTHFTHDANDINTQWYTVESKKEPLESRIWYNYPGQPTSGGLGAAQSGAYDLPSAIGRVLDNGQTQLTEFAYNAAGNQTDFVDPVGRQTSLAYAANQIDVISVTQATVRGQQTIAKFAYNNQHRPLTYTDAAGQTTHYTYNSAGQLTSQTNPLGQKTIYNYNSTGDLIEIVNADGKPAASFTYDSADRVASFTDAGGWKVDFGYDNADRVTAATYPDGTTEQYTYHWLDLASYTDRQGRVWTYGYDADRRLTAVTDPLGQKTTYTYYENNALKSLTDPNGHMTSWGIDVESRPTAKIYADGTATTYSYELTTSRLAAVTDALGQTRKYQYALDNRLAGIGYEGALNPTHAVSFDYDPYFPRLVSMIDGTGTTSYSYVPVGSLGALRLSQESGPLPNEKIIYGYDKLGRVVTRTVNGASAENFAYDKIGRLIGHTDALGKFATTYLGETQQPILRQLAGGSVATTWSYLPNSGDRRLAEIDNKFPNERQFHYTTTPDNLITKIVEDKSGSLQQSWNFGYDNDKRLISADASVAGKYGYTLDPVGNITSFKAPSGTSGAAYNAVNELTELSGTPYTYDADGNLIADGVRTYSWDAESRLIGIAQAGAHTNFAYDGMSRRVEITTMTSGKASTIDYIWCGTRICQSRNGKSAVARLYYHEGEVIPAAIAADDTLFYYGPDQLGSVRDVYAKSPLFSMVEAYDYDPYGNPTAGPKTGPFTDFRYAGMFSPSNGAADGGLYLTQYRGYDPRIGRWLSPDPIGEKGGLNRYNYVLNDPMALVDRLGLKESGGGFCQRVCVDAFCSYLFSEAGPPGWFLGGALGEWLNGLLPPIIPDLPTRIQVPPNLPNIPIGGNPFGGTSDSPSTGPDIVNNGQNGNPNVNVNLGPNSGYGQPANDMGLPGF